MTVTKVCFSLVALLISLLHDSGETLQPETVTFDQPLIDPPPLNSDPPDPEGNYESLGDGLFPGSSQDKPQHPQWFCDRGSCFGRCVNDGPQPPWKFQDLMNKDEKTCECSPDCIIFGECCADYFELCLQTNLSTLISGIKTTSDVDNMLQSVVPRQQYVTEMLAMFLHKSCFRVKNRRKIQDYWMISTCPKATGETRDEMKCTGITWDPLGEVPVSLKSHPSVVFRNIYCALCHGAPTESVTFWQSAAICPEDIDANSLKYEQVLELIRTKVCQMSNTAPGDTEPHVCEGRHGDICPLVWENGTLLGNILMCRSYTHHMVTSDDVEIRNVHCAACSSSSSVRTSSLGCKKTFHFHGRLLPECEDLSCEGRCNTSNAACQCDNLCILFGDCCFDYLEQCQAANLTFLDMQNETIVLEVLQVNSIEPRTHETEETTSTNFSQTEKGQVSENTDIKQLLTLYMNFRECVAIPEINLKMIWAIARCPAGNTTSQCEDQHFENNRSLIAPASHADDNSLVFKNIFCGLCHGIPKEKLQIWETAIFCQEAVRVIKSEEEMLSQEGCSLIVVGEGGRLCFTDDQTVTPDNSSVIQPWCKIYRYPVRSTQSHQYRNPHCTESDTFCIIRMEYENDPEGSDLPSDLVGGLSILFKFEGNDLNLLDSSGKQIKTETVCQSDEVFDYFDRKCKMLLCKAGQIALNGSCFSNGTQIARKHFQLFPDGSNLCLIKTYIWSTKPFTFENFRPFYEFIDQGDHKNMIDILDSMNVTLNSDIRPDTFNISNEGKRTSIEMRFARNTSLLSYLNVLSHLAGLFHNFASRIGIKVLDVTIQNFEKIEDLICRWGEVVNLGTPYLEELHSVLYVSDNVTLYPLEKTAFMLRLNNTFSIPDAFWACGIPLKCDPVAYNLSDFVFSGSFLKSKLSDQVLEKETYFINGDIVLACHNFTRSYSNQSQIFFRFDHVQDILTYVTSGISILSLAITLVVYCILPQLRNLPGRLTMSLSASLLVAQVLLLLIHVPKGVLCKVHAVALHFFWLCSFMWMGMMSVNLAITFRSNSSQQSSARTTSYRKYACLAIGLPFIIVTISALLDFLQVEGVFIGYGMFGTCWIANPRASLLLFGVPLASILTINILAFGLTLFSIERSLKLSKGLESTKKDKGKAFIYGKLFIIMGLSWISSFIAAFTGIRYLWYIFIILNGLQGFCIFTSFICTERVKKHLLKKWGRSEASSAYTTSTGAPRTSEIKSQ